MLDAFNIFDFFTDMKFRGIYHFKCCLFRQKMDPIDIFLLFSTHFEWKFEKTKKIDNIVLSFMNITFFCSSHHRIIKIRGFLFIPYYVANVKLRIDKNIFIFVLFFFRYFSIRCLIFWKSNNLIFLFIN